MKERRYDVDWLRVVATLAIFLYHCSRFFGTESWELKNAEQNLIINVVRTGLVWPWVMELFFLLSGVGSWYALRSRTAGQYLLERIKRLLIPLYTVVNEPFSMRYLLFQITVSVLSWSAVVCMLSLGARRLNSNHPRLAYANEAVLPFYLFHQTIILCVGWFVIRWRLGILPKYLIVIVLSFPLILLLYELLVRRYNVVRFFFGMRPRS